MLPIADTGPGGDRPAGSLYARVTVPSRVESIRQAVEFIVRTARHMQVPAASAPLFEVAIAEALNNAFNHGNAAQVPGARIVCELERIDRTLTVRIHDEGQGFSLQDERQAEWSASDVASIPESGFGLPLIREVFQSVRTVRTPGAFVLELALAF